MHLRSLRLLQAPGLAREILLPDIAPGLVLLHGPNASGKSTLGRVLHGTLWATRAPAGVTSVCQWATREGERSASLMAQRVQWQPEMPAIPAAAVDAWRLSVTELLRSDSHTDRAIADAIERALTGGYDIAAAARAFATSANAPPNLSKGLLQARQAHQDARGRAEALHRQEQQLAVARQRQRDALTARGQLEPARRALQAWRDRSALEAVDQELAAMPAGMDALLGDELDRLGDLRQTSEAAAREGRELTRKIEALRAQEAALQFPGGEPALEVVAAWRERARALSLLDAGVGPPKAALHVAVQTADEVERRVLSAASRDDARLPGRADLDALEAALEARGALTERLAALQGLTDALRADAPLEDPEAIRDAIGSLRAWLAVPGSASSASTPAWPTPMAAVGATLLLVGAALAAASAQASLGAWLGLLGALCLGAGVGAQVALRQAAAGDPGAQDRAAHRRHFERSGGSPPSSWQPEDVQSHLARLEAEQDQRRDAAWRAERCQALLGLSARLNEDLQARDRQVQEVTRTLGLHPEWSALTLLQQAHRLLALDGAETEALRARAALDAASEQCEAQRQALSAWLRTLALPEVADGAGAVVAVDGVHARLQALAAARESLLDLQARGLAERERGERSDRARAALYGRCGLPPGDDDGLRARLALRPTWLELQQRRRDLKRDLCTVPAQAEQTPQWLDLPASDLQVRIDELEQRASGYESWTEEVARVEQSLKAATLGSELADARKAMRDAEDRLAEVRERAAEDAVGRAVAGWLRGRVSREHTPTVLARARALLLGFTRHKFDLEVDADAGFVAIDVDAGQRRSLSQLSDGTRMQLLLAARIAFLEQTEGDGVKLPLFLDEALSTTDPRRFEAICGALLDLVASGRQVIYATADLAEISAWQHVCRQRGARPAQVIALEEATVRGDWRPEVPAAPIRPPETPQTVGHNAASYARALGVPPPVPSDPATRWHVLHLLHDDLPAVRALVACGVETVGQVLAWRAGDEVPLPLSEPTAVRFEARARLLEAVIELRAIGRNRPLRWRHIEDSGAVTPAFAERARALLRTHGDDAGQYFEAFSALKSLRAQSRDGLRQHLIREGLLADSPPLPREELIRRAASRVARQVDDGVLPLGEVAATVDWVAGLFAAGGAVVAADPR